MLVESTIRDALQVVTLGESLTWLNAVTSMFSALAQVPRFDARQGMTRVSNTFGADIFGADMSYFTAVLSVSGAYFAIGVCGFHA